MPLLLFIFALLLLQHAPNSHADPLVIGGSGSDLKTFELLCTEFSQQHPGFHCDILPSIGSSGGIKAVLKQKIDLGLASRTPKEEEKHEHLVFNHYGRTPLVFAVPMQSAITNLTRQQILAIYAGDKTNWDDNHLIKPILRPANDSDNKILSRGIDGFAQAFAKAYSRRNLPLAVTDQDSARLIATLEGAIGSSTLALIKTENVSIKAIKLDNIAPTVANINNGSYALFKELYLVYHTKNIKPALKQFVDFVFSSTGQALLEQTGHSVSIK